MTDGARTRHATCALCRRGHDREAPARGRPEAGRIGEMIAEVPDRPPAGAGGMGVVYEAQHTRRARRFAVKFLRRDLAERRDILTRFHREAEAAGALESEHIAAAVDFGIAEDGAPYIVMEYLVGESLAALLAREGRLPVARAADLVAQACRGLAGGARARGSSTATSSRRTCSSAGGGDGTDLVKVLDFGVAKLQAADGTEAAITADRRGGGDRLLHVARAGAGRTTSITRTDVYALGAILYELLTAHQGAPGDELQRRAVPHPHAEARAAAPRAAPDVPEGLARIVERAMAYDRADRYQTVAALLEALLFYAGDAGARVGEKTGAPAGDGARRDDGDAADPRVGGRPDAASTSGPIEGDRSVDRSRRSRGRGRRRVASSFAPASAAGGDTFSGATSRRAATSATCRIARSRCRERGPPPFIDACRASGLRRPRRSAATGRAPHRTLPSRISRGSAGCARAGRATAPPSECAPIRHPQSLR